MATSKQGAEGTKDSLKSFTFQHFSNFFPYHLLLRSHKMGRKLLMINQGNHFVGFDREQLKSFRLCIILWGEYLYVHIQVNEVEKKFSVSIEWKTSYIYLLHEF